MYTGNQALGSGAGGAIWFDTIESEINVQNDIYLDNTIEGSITGGGAILLSQLRINMTF
jgi:hypothetical protein